MNDRTTRPMKESGYASGGEPVVSYNPDNPILSVELNKTYMILTRNIEVLDKILASVSGSVCKECSGKPPGPVPLIAAAKDNHELAADIGGRLEELARLLG